MNEIHPSWFKAGSDIAVAIMQGQHDSELETIANACKVRLKQMFRKGQKVKLVGTKNVDIDGKIATITKVNQKSISIGIGTPKTEFGSTYYPEGEYNVPPRMLEAVS